MYFQSVLQQTISSKHFWSRAYVQLLLSCPSAQLYQFTTPTFIFPNTTGALPQSENLLSISTISKEQFILYLLITTCPELNFLYSFFNAHVHAHVHQCVSTCTSAYSRPLGLSDWVRLTSKPRDVCAFFSIGLRSTLNMGATYWIQAVWQVC